MGLLNYIRNEGRVLQHYGKDLLRALVEKPDVEITPGKQGVLLIHGVLGPRYTMHYLERKLDEDGVVAVRKDYDFTKPIFEIMPIMQDEIKRITNVSGRRAKIVGHSKGALIATKLGQYMPKEVETVVGLAGPYWGTNMATPSHLVPGMDWAHELSPLSLELKRIRKGGLDESVRLEVIRGEYDWICGGGDRAPFSGPNVTEYMIDSIGHWGVTGLIAYPVIFHSLLKEPVLKKSQDQLKKVG